MSERRLEAAIEVAHLGSWEWDVRADRVTWSHELYGIFGMKPGQLVPSYAGYLAALHPEDRVGVDVFVKRAYEDKRPYTVEHRVVWPDGTVRWVLGRGKVITDDRGDPVKFIGTAQDITDQKLALDAVQKASMTRDFVRSLLTGFIHDGGVHERAIREMGRRIAQDVAAKTVDEALDRYRELGLGVVRLVSTEGQVLTFEADDLIERVPKAPRPTCFMTLSFLEGVVAATQAASALGTETRCQSRGHERCRFVVRVDPIAPRASARGPR